MALIVAKEQWQIVQYRLDRIEQFLSQGAIQAQPQSHRSTLRQPADSSTL
jgi:hypothetical protein